MREFLLLALFYAVELLKFHNNFVNLKRYNILNDKLFLMNASIANLYKNKNITKF
tara:strand:- start:2051 stop:2215 length:165 start_codon:yes stop_codon:yes gene_type:complete